MISNGFDRRRRPEAASFGSWSSPDGWRHRRMDWRQPAGRKARGSLLFAGGRGDFIEKYLEPMAHWHERGWNVASFDWRGQGGSRGDIVGGHLDSLDPLLEDLTAFIADWQRERQGPHVAVAHSMGGHMLLRALVEERVAIDAAVLVAPMLQVNSAPLPPSGAWWVATALSAAGWAQQPIWSRGSSSAPAGSQRQAILTSCPDRYEDEMWWWKEEPGFNLGSPSWGWLNAAYRSCAALTPARLKRIATPLLFVGTERDRLVSAAAIRRVAGLVPSAELMMFSDAGHEILRESDAVRLEAMQRIDRFFEENAAS